MNFYECAREEDDAAQGSESFTRIERGKDFYRRRLFVNLLIYLKACELLA